MLKVAVFVCVCAAAWCSPALAAAGGRPDSGNFLDDKQWLTTISQYDKEVGQWNKFRDVSSTLPAGSRARRAPPAAPCLAVWFRSLRASLGRPGLGCSLDFPPSPQNFNFYFDSRRRLGGRRREDPPGSSRCAAAAERRGPPAVPWAVLGARPAPPGPSGPGCGSCFPPCGSPAVKRLRLSFPLPGSRPAAGAAAAGRAVVGARAAALGRRSPPKAGARPARSGSARGRGGPGLAPSPLCECRLGKSPLPPGSGAAQSQLAAVRSAERAGWGRRGCGHGRGRGEALWEVLERGSWQGSPLSEAVMVPPECFARSA